MREDIPIGQTGVINNVPVKAVAPENYIDLCHGCHFQDKNSDEPLCLASNTRPICSQPDRIFKQIIE